MSGHVDLDRLPPRRQPSTPPDISAGEEEVTVIVRRGIDPCTLADLLDWVAASSSPISKMRRLEIARHALRGDSVDESLSDLADRLGVTKQAIHKQLCDFLACARESHARHFG